MSFPLPIAKNCPNCGSEIVGESSLSKMKIFKCESSLGEHGIAQSNACKIREPLWNDYNENRVKLLQYESLRHHFDKMTNEVLGKDYYNMGMDVYTCDEIICQDITRKAKQSALERLLG